MCFGTAFPGKARYALLPRLMSASQVRGGGERGTQLFWGLAVLTLVAHPSCDSNIQTHIYVALELLAPPRVAVHEPRGREIVPPQDLGKPCVQGLGFSFHGFRVQGFRVQGSGFKDIRLGFRV